MNPAVDPQLDAAPTPPMTLPQAIATQEGFYARGPQPNSPQRNHNPGNIIWGAFAKANGALQGDNAFYACFPDDATGFAALLALLSGPAYKGKTVEVAINRYCPPPDGSELTDGNNPDVYVKNVCAWCRCSPDTIIDGLLGPVLVTGAGGSPAASPEANQ